MVQGRPDALNHSHERVRWMSQESETCMAEAFCGASTSTMTVRQGRCQRRPLGLSSDTLVLVSMYT
jgi:hypothetical protein